MPSDITALSWAYLKSILKILVPALAFSFLGLEIYKLIQDVDVEQLHLQVDALAASFALLALLFLADAAGWNLILRSLQQRLPWGKALYIWFYSSLSRYIPGVVWPYLSRMQMCNDHGISKTVTASSMMLENLLLAATSVGLSSPLLILYFQLNMLQTLGIILAVLFAATLSVYLYRSMLTIRFLDRYLFPLKTLNLHALLSLTLYYLAFWLLFGYSFLVFCQSILTIDPAQRLSVALTFPVSFAIGFIISISPGGLGIREGVMYTLLAPILGSSNAALIAVVSRIWLMAMELLIALGIAIALLVKRSLRHR